MSLASVSRYDFGDRVAGAGVGGSPSALPPGEPQRWIAVGGVVCDSEAVGGRVGAG